jgi:inosine triphosphate pyrophosphatase
MLTFVTGNANKLAEVQAILHPYTVTSHKLDLPEWQGADPREIALAKCRQAYAELKVPVMTEDTCLCFNAMKGLPGAYIKWFLQSLGHEGLNKMLNGFEDRSAYALCIFVLIDADGREHVFEGRCEGEIVAARGPANFGWDPIFQPAGFTETFAQMDKSVKNSISHRARALEQLKTYLSATKSE